MMTVALLIRRLRRHIGERVFAPRPKAREGAAIS
jgi:hypothetical protein